LFRAALCSRGSGVFSNSILKKSKVLWKESSEHLRQIEVAKVHYVASFIRSESTRKVSRVFLSICSL
jgi:hypothetical protein